MKNPCAKDVQSEKGCTVRSPLTRPSAKKSDGTKELATTDSMDNCSLLHEIQLVGASLRVDTTRDVFVGVHSPFWSCRSEVRVKHQTAFRGSTPDFSSRLSPEVLATRGYLRKTAGAFNQSFPSPSRAAKVYRASPSSLPVMSLTTRSEHVVFAYGHVVRPHRSYRPSGGLPRGKPRTSHMWI